MCNASQKDEVDRAEDEALRVVSDVFKTPSNITIHHLTINNYGSPDKSNMQQKDGLCKENGHSAAVTMQTARIQIKNNLPINVQKVILSHYYGNEDNMQRKVWKNIQSGSITPDEWYVLFGTGSSAAEDSWQVKIEFTDGDGVTDSDKWKCCKLQESDAQERGILTFEINSTSFAINLRSGGTTMDIVDTKLGDNAFAFVRVVNSSKNILRDIELEHQQAKFVGLTKRWSGSFKRGDFTSWWPVFFNVDHNMNDSWCLSLKCAFIDDEAHEMKPLKQSLGKDDCCKLFDAIISDDGWKLVRWT